MSGPVKSDGVCELLESFPQVIIVHEFKIFL
jgi:hypothetical protein